MDNENYQEMVLTIRKHKTQNELAIALGTFEQAIRRYERGGYPQSQWTREAIKSLYAQYKTEEERASVSK